ncbi:hypothetical protein [Neptuniibacter sp. QD37_11]|uniref:hypothetical protein n=1 Tax=Neptuniibacter sp. QD37_11 TaxID=3398209 RepID=UPI0039F51626
MATPLEGAATQLEKKKDDLRLEDAISWLEDVATPLEDTATQLETKRKKRAVC